MRQRPVSRRWRGRYCFSARRVETKILGLMMMGFASLYPSYGPNSAAFARRLATRSSTVLLIGQQLVDTLFKVNKIPSFFIQR
jgi:hypothetical protein